jgi:antitoxin VapB
MHRDGDRLVIEPVRKKGLIALLASLDAIDEDFGDLDAVRLPARPVDL